MIKGLPVLTATEKYFLSLENLLQESRHNNPMVKLNQDTQNKLQELQMAEQGLQNTLLQKQAFQMELNELDSAIEETKKADDDVFKIIGSIMVKSNKADILKELEEKKNIFSLRLKTLENQEKILSERFENLKSNIEQELKKQK